jgi:hypothetical protein
MYVDSSLKREAKFLDIQSIGGRVTYDPRQKKLMSLIIATKYTIVIYAYISICSLRNKKKR